VHVFLPPWKEGRAPHESGRPLSRVRRPDGAAVLTALRPRRARSQAKAKFAVSAAGWAAQLWPDIFPLGTRTVRVTLVEPSRTLLAAFFSTSISLVFALSIAPTL